MQKSSHLRWLTLLSPLLTLVLLPKPLFGAPIQQTYSKNFRLLGYLETISMAQCSSKGTGTHIQKQFAQLIHRVEELMRQQQLLSPSETVSCTCMKCVLTETATQTTRSWTF